ncbi:hypothetical protein [Desulfobacter hydrogenophilus]|nr:hypothetical protein [Desulfobacter hydrogenophilus]
MDKIGEAHLFNRENQAISIIYKGLDPTICHTCHQHGILITSIGYDIRLQP